MCFADMYLEIFLADFAVFRVFLGISRDFAEILEFRGSATARIIRSPGYDLKKYLDLFHQSLCLFNVNSVSMIVESYSISS